MRVGGGEEGWEGGGGGGGGAPAGRRVGGRRRWALGRSERERLHALDGCPLLSGGCPLLSGGSTQALKPPCPPPSGTEATSHGSHQALKQHTTTPARAPKPPTWGLLSSSSVAQASGVAAALPAACSEKAARVASRRPSSSTSRPSRSSPGRDTSTWEGARGGGREHQARHSPSLSNFSLSLPRPC